MLLTGLGWPMIYFVRRRHGVPARAPAAHAEDRAGARACMQILSLFAAIAYELVIWWKGSLTVFDGGGAAGNLRRLSVGDAATAA